MKKVINIVLIVLAVLLQTTIIAKTTIVHSMINLPLIIMVSLILIKRFDIAIWWMGAGLILDFISPSKFGLYTIIFIVVYLLVNAVIKKIFYQMGLHLVILFLVLSSIIIDIPFLFYNFTPQILVGNFIYNTIVGCIIYWLLKYYLEPQNIIKIKI